LQVDILLFSSDVKSDICLLNVTDTDPITGCGISIRSNPLIIGGQSTAPGQWPWHVALFHHNVYNTTYQCGGSFVGTRTIITGMFMYWYSQLVKINGSLQMEKLCIEYSGVCGGDIFVLVCLDTWKW